MTQLCVPIFVRDFAQAQRDMLLAAESGADLIELRVDSFDDPSEIATLIEKSPCPCILTRRPMAEGGENEDADVERVSFLNDCAPELPRYTDIELATYRSFPDAAKRDHWKRIISVHDFAGRPERLYNLINELSESTGDVNKIVWMARSIRDNLEAFEIIQTRSKPTIALCMGEAGLISRVLAKKFGAFLTFASLRDESATAPGQITIRDIKQLYRWDSIGPQTKVFGVVASPVKHSMSPAIHNAAFDETGYDGVYLPLFVQPGYEAFKAFMESFLAFSPLDLKGLSITIPHKENALRYLKDKGAEIDPLAERIGAVNTIMIDRIEDQADEMAPPRRSKSGDATNSAPSKDSSIPKLRGTNTDYSAILDAITGKLNIQRSDLSNYRVAVIGAGGTGRTAVAALAACGATVVVYNRTVDRAESLANEFNGHTGKVVAASIEKLCQSCCQIYINTTSIGMHPNIDASPFGNESPKLSPDTLVFDAVYNPLRTKLIAQAEEAGAKTIGGIEMFLRQAAAQFEGWTGVKAPTDVMRQVIESRLQAPEL